MSRPVDPNRVAYGIQGGKGSFNEEAINYYLQNRKIKRYRIRYLYTSGNVLKALNAGEITQGQFAIHNSAGGMVQESIRAMARFKFKIVDQFSIKICHVLMVRPEVNFSKITTIMTHPQVLAQCKQTLKQKYSHLKQVSGSGKLIDHAVVAKNLAEKKLPENIATMGSKILAELYGLNVVDNNLQDLTENYTSFLVVGR